MSKEAAYKALLWGIDDTEPCRQAFDDEGKPNDPDKWTGNWVNSTEPEVAEALCAGCHVLDECLTYALMGEEKHHIWGGTTPQQRKEILDARRPNPKKTGLGPIKHAKRKNKAT